MNPPLVKSEEVQDAVREVKENEEKMHNYYEKCIRDLKAKNLGLELSLDAEEREKTKFML